MSTAYLLLGSNQGNSLALLGEARRLVELQCGEIIAASTIHPTAAWGPVPQPDYQNQALGIETLLPAEVLLHNCLQIEAQLGRRRTVRWGPRTMDIDLLFYDALILETPALQLPHPRLHERLFGLAPLVEIAPEWVHPVLHKTIATLLAELK